jgi:hypothetical protein
MEGMKSGGPARLAGLESWATRWFVALGAALALGMLLPIVIEHGLGGRRGASRVETVWLWDLLDEAPARAILALLLPLVLGVVTLAVAPSSSGRRRAIALFCCATATLLLGAVLGRGFALAGPMRVPSVRDFLLILMTLAGISIAVGNRLRRGWPAALAPRLLAGLGGCVLVAGFLLPLGAGDETMLSVLFDEDFWDDEAWPLAAWVSLMFLYGVCGLFAFASAPGPALHGLTTFFGRAVLLGLPAALLVAWLISSDGKAPLTALMLVIKLPAILYGTPGILAVALTAWIGHSLGGSPAAAAAPPSSDLAARLARLDQARASGLLTDAEYELKRRQIIDSTAF